MITATERLHALIRRDIEHGPKIYALHFGHDWFNITPADAEVFQLSLDDLPSLVAVWYAYEAVLDICNVLDVPPDLAAAFRADHPFIAELWGEGTNPSTISPESFQQFAKLFGVPFRKSFAWYMRLEFYHIRVGIARFKDEVDAPHAPTSNQTDDDEIPF